MAKFGKKAETVAAVGTPSVGTAAQGKQTAAGLPRKGCKPNVPWEFKYHPERVEFNEAKGGWIYRLGRLHITAGIEGIGRNNSNTEEAVARSDRRGWTLIPIGTPALGKFANYVIGYQVQGGGTQHLPIWVTPRVLGKNRTIIEVDEEMQIEFMDLLMKKVCEPIDPAIIDDKVRRQAQRVVTIEGDLSSNPTAPMLQARYNREKRRLALMRGEDPSDALREAKELVAAMRAQSAAQ